MTSVERLCEYHTLDQEADRHTNVRPPSEWPSRGEIHIQNLSVQYMHDGSYALKDITIHVKPGEKVLRVNDLLFQGTSNMQSSNQ